MRFAVLGPLQVGHADPVELHRPSHRRLLSLLLLEAGRPVTTDELIDRLWGDEPPRTARAALQTYVSQLRRTLGAELIRATGGGYLLDRGGHRIDRDEFESRADAARAAHASGAWMQAAEAAEKALAMWRGAPFPELVDDPAAQPEIARLEELRLVLAEVRGEALLAMGRVEQALPELERLAAENPLRERLWELLMLARTRAGRPADALEAYQRLRAALGDIGLEPSPTLRELEERIFREDSALVPPRVHHNLPTPIASFIGRRSELRDLRERGGRHRLVTLSGVGGAGKTRLAIEAARTMLADHPDGVYLVDLVGVPGPEAVVTEVAVTMGLRTGGSKPIDTIIEALQQRRVLLLMDNCEHLLDACAGLIEEVLERSATTNVLATSREALGIPGEIVYAVPPLAVPPVEETDANAIRAFDSVQLFADRARAVEPGFGVTPKSLGPVAEICRHLDGLPLAIELAAARAGSLGIESLAHRLRGRLALLSDRRGRPRSRHRTLEAAIDWSYRLLDDDERRLLELLSVFAGGWTLDAAEDVCSGDGLRRDDIALLLGRLVTRSLVARAADVTEDRYRLLETIRAFARARLVEGTVGAESLELRHRDRYLQLADAAAQRFESAEQGKWLDRLARERDNLAAALECSLRHGERRQASRLAEALGWYWLRSGYSAAAVSSMRASLETTDEGSEPERAAEIHVRLAGTLYSSADEAGALAEARRACELVETRAPSPAKVRALSEYAGLHQRIVQQDPEPAVRAARGAVEAARAIGDRFAESHALRTLGTALSWSGAVDDGLAHLRRALDAAREVDNPTAVLGVFMRLYITQLDMARSDEAAAAVADEALEWLDAGGGRWAGAASLLMWFASGFARKGETARAEALLDRSASYHLEGAMLMSYHSLRALLRCMQGRLTEARTELTHLRNVGATPRYFRLLYPIAAEVAAEEESLDEVRALAEEHLAATLIPAEEPTRAGTLRALARAEADAAQSSTGAARRDHRRRARRAVTLARRLLARHPPSVLSGLSLEPADAWLQLAEAELTRADAASPDAWRVAGATCLFAYWRTYAHWRLGESLLESGGPDEAAAQLRAARAQAEAMGAHLLRGRIDATMRRAGLGVDRT